MLFERSKTKRVHFSVPERPFRSRPGDVALIFSFCYFILLHQGKRKSKSIRMANTQSKNTKRNQKKKLLQSKLLQLIKRAVEHIKVNTLRNTRQLTNISMLPELPLTLILHRISIIMSYPIRISIKNRIRQITSLKLIRSVKNRF